MYEWGNMRVFEIFLAFSTEFKTIKARRKAVPHENREG
jgi:hypothetical protein